MVLCVVLLIVMRRRRWPLSRGALVFVAALIPFGPFLALGIWIIWLYGPLEFGRAM